MNESRRVTIFPKGLFYYKDFDTARQASETKHVGIHICTRFLNTLVVRKLSYLHICNYKKMIKN